MHRPNLAAARHMTVVIDTNVVAYLLLGTERFVAELRRS